MSVRPVHEALEDYTRAVRECRLVADDARARIERAAAVLDEVKRAVAERRRRAEKRERRQGTPRA